MRPTAAAVAAVPMLLLAGCGATFDYAALRAFEAPGAGFDAALSREYKALALYEADAMHDWPDAARFGAKAYAAAAGTAKPEDPRDWRLPAGTRGAIFAASARLGAALADGARVRAPAETATAQARFDCWLEQQEENWQTAHIARCREGFQAALAAVETTLARSPGAGSATPAALGGVGAGDTPRAFTLFFAFDSAGLGDEARRVVARVAREAAAGHGVRVLVGGHADRSGTAAHNDALSWRRADAVRAALIAAGVGSERIAIRAYGETRTRVATPDGIRHPANRRVEITVGTASGT